MSGSGGLRRGVALGVLAVSLVVQGLLLAHLTENAARGPATEAWLLGALALLLAAVGGLLLHDGARDAEDPANGRVGTTDPLTRTLNRRGFMGAAAQEFTRSVRYSRPLSVLAVKVDLSGVSGAVARDTALERLSAAWQTEIRTTDTVGRIARDAFAILLPETEEQTAGDLAQRIRRASESLPPGSLPAGQPLAVRVGLSSIATGDSGIEHALARADASLAGVPLRPA